MRATVYLLIVFLVLTQFLGFATGDFALQLWSKHPRHASAQHDESPRTVVKLPPATVGLASAAPVLAVIAAVTVPEEVLSLPVVSRPPFVPPRA